MFAGSPEQVMQLAPLGTWLETVHVDVALATQLWLFQVKVAHRESEHSNWLPWAHAARAVETSSKQMRRFFVIFYFIVDLVLRSNQLKFVASKLVVFE